MVNPNIPPQQPGPPLPPDAPQPPREPQTPIAPIVIPSYRPYKTDVVEEMRQRLAAQREALTTPEPLAPMPLATPEERRAKYDEWKAERQARLKDYSKADPNSDTRKSGYNVQSMPPGTQRTPTVERPGFEPYPSRISAGATSVGGLRRWFTSSGREELRTERQRRAAQRQRVAAYTVGRVRDPRGTAVDPSKAPVGPGDRGKHGWVGTHKLFYEGLPGIGGADAGDIGDLIMKGRITDPRASITPNTLRPVTKKEQWDDFRLDGQMRRERKNRSDAEWLERSYPDVMDPRSGARLRSSEQRHMRKTAKKAIKQTRKAAKAQRKMDRLAGEI